MFIEAWLQVFIPPSPQSSPDSQDINTQSTLRLPPILSNVYRSSVTGVYPPFATKLA
ncbi:Protein of unknown function [Pyronema omphalodes CBS 100304]|uniref:Uncharacterized protein n=1 Tax=Pyronema omphalodes (strain CBS 100304) TaxID=1076935 RepID=U4LTA6_PYROM|nr:Protein of unknown function [Pyronema omphalodes CBS 100304]